MIKKLIPALTIGLLASSIVATDPASAYPPGRNLTSALTPDMVLAKTGKASLNISNAKPQVSLNVSGYKSQQNVSIDEAGFGTATLKSLTSGIWTVRVKQVYKNYGSDCAGLPSRQVPVDGKIVTECDVTETALNTLYVPKVIAPKTVKIKSKLYIKLSYLKPKTLLTLTPTAGKKKKKAIKVKVGTKATTAKITIPAKTFVKGKNSFVLTIGKLKLTYKLTGK